MRESREFILEKFREVNRLGFVPCRRSRDAGIGRTFEDYVGVVENIPERPDLAGYEIRSHREESMSYITLFTKAPGFPVRANAYLVERFGTSYEGNPALKKLHASMFSSRYSTRNNPYSFRLIHDRSAGLLRIGVYDVQTKQLLDACAGYTYGSLERKLQAKLKNLFYVSAERRYRASDGVEEFYFNRAEIYGNPSLDRFLQLIDDGLIMYDIRIGSYRSGRNFGKVHDHGSGFRIIESNLRLLYRDHEIVEPDLSVK